MAVRNILDAIMAGDMTTAQSELTTEMNTRRDDLIEQGRQFIAANVQYTGELENQE